MGGVRKRGETIRQFILEHVDEHPADITAYASEALGISRQAINKHIQHLVAQGALVAEGTTRNRRYSLRLIEEKLFSYELQGLREDVVWRNDIAPLLSELPAHVREIWQYGFTEMLNNAIDHSSGSQVGVFVAKTAVSTELLIFDDGEGIFRKLKRELNLDDECHAVLELAKGKLTTDPVHHTGEGIFFSSRMFDSFTIRSGNTRFSHDYGEEVNLIDETLPFDPVTTVWMSMVNNTTRTTREVFGSFTSGEDLPGFTKTMVPVRLAQYGDEKLISRSQAKRLLARFDRFKTVVLDFTGVESLGQAFADEVFRVFVHEHPGTELVETKTCPAVQQMIDRARARD